MVVDTPGQDSICCTSINSPLARPGPLARAISQSRPLGYNSTANACVKGRQGVVPDGDLELSWTEDARR